MEAALKKQESYLGSDYAQFNFFIAACDQQSVSSQTRKTCNLVLLNLLCLERAEPPKSAPERGFSKNGKMDANPLRPDSLAGRQA